MKTQLVSFVNPGEVDVYLRIDRGHGRIEYEMVATIAVAAPPERREQRLTAWLPDIVNALLGL